MLKFQSEKGIAPFDVRMRILTPKNTLFVNIPFNPLYHKAAESSRENGYIYFLPSLFYKKVYMKEYNNY